MALQHTIDCNPNSIIATAQTVKPGGGAYPLMDQAVAKTTPGGGKRQFITQTSITNAQMRALHTAAVNLPGLAAPPAAFMYVVDWFMLETGAAVGSTPGAGGGANPVGVGNSTTGTYNGVGGFAASTNGPVAAGTYQQLGGAVGNITLQLNGVDITTAVSGVTNLEGATPGVLFATGVSIGAAVQATVAGQPLSIFASTANYTGTANGQRYPITVAYRIVPISNP